MHAIRFEQVEYRVGSAVLLHSLSMSIEPGETLVLLGKSGSGKTTLLKLINRLLIPTAGQIHFSDRNMTDWNPIQLRRKIGYVIQETGLFPHYTVFENVSLIPRLEKWDSTRMRQRSEEVLQMVGLDPAQFSGRYPHQLSGGQRQRVGVARALCADPPVMLMDEPFGALDPITRSEIQNEFSQLQQRLKKTIVFVTHDVAEALIVGDRIGFLADGRLLTLLTRKEVLTSRDPAILSFLSPIRNLASLIPALQS